MTNPTPPTPTADDCRETADAVTGTRLDSLRAALLIAAAAIEDGYQLDRDTVTKPCPKCDRGMIGKRKCNCPPGCRIPASTGGTK